MGATSRVTSQGQISIPAEVRRALGIGPGSVLEWEPRDGAFIVRRAGRFNSADVHAALFGKHAKSPEKPVDAKAAIRSAVRRRHARR
ncbi:MAG: AbrB/MazE/SpoVT family DNA-binding domain-containing protein [Steroidobacteraceae bacterium]